MNVTVKFDEVAVRAKKTFRCTCGRRCVRSKKFYQTLNPFNKDSNGITKSHWVIEQELQKQATAWKQVVEPCTHMGWKAEYR